MLAASVTLAASALAYPDGAPWGSADPSAATTCAGCHNDFAPVRDSDALNIVGLPPTLIAGQTYALDVNFVQTDAARSGFQLLVVPVTHGSVTSESDDTDTSSNGARSIAVKAPGANGRFSWPVTLTATTAGELRLLVAASQANNDQSSLGDQIHYREYRLAVVHDDSRQTSPASADTQTKRNQRADSERQRKDDEILLEPQATGNQ